jgi:hypothetical protein
MLEHGLTDNFVKHVSGIEQEKIFRLDGLVNAII